MRDSTATGPLQPIPCLALGSQGSEATDLALTLISSRHNISPRRLSEPGPTPEQLHCLLLSAAAAPDHGTLTPWRFIIVPADRRHLLAEAFALALVDRDPGATLEQIESARQKAHRAPLLMVAVARLGPREPDTPALERMVSMGAAIQNMLLAAHAMGFGGGLTSGKAMASPRLHRLCGLSEHETPVCCVNVGTVTVHKAPARARPWPSDFVTELQPPADHGSTLARPGTPPPTSITLPPTNPPGTLITP